MIFWNSFGGSWLRPFFSQIYILKQNFHIYYHILQWRFRGSGSSPSHDAGWFNRRMGSCWRWRSLQCFSSETKNFPRRRGPIMQTWIPNWRKTDFRPSCKYNNWMFLWGHIMYKVNCFFTPWWYYSSWTPQIIISYSKPSIQGDQVLFLTFVVLCSQKARISDILWYYSIKLESYNLTWPIFSLSDYIK